MCPLGLRSGDCAACGTGDTCVGNDGAEGPSPARHPLRIEVFFDAVRDHDLAAARKLLERTPALVDATQPFGITALHVAAEVGDTAMIDLLLRFGADVNSRRQGADETPLAAAVRTGQLKAVRALLAHGADLGFTSGNGQSLLSIAARHGHEELVRLLLDRKLDPNGGVPADWPLRTAASAGHLEIVRLLVARGADVKGRRRDGSPVLTYPIGAWKAEIVTFLLENDVPRRSDLFRDRLASAWKLAVRLRRTEAAIAILNAGLDLKDLTLD
jgi:ankyrin repeat protein